MKISVTQKETAQSIGTMVKSTVEKDVLVDADLFPVSDSAAANVLKKIPFSVMKTLFSGGSAAYIPPPDTYVCGTQYANTAKPFYKATDFQIAINDAATDGIKKVKVVSDITLTTFILLKSGVDIDAKGFNLVCGFSDGDGDTSTAVVCKIEATMLIGVACDAILTWNIGTILKVRADLFGGAGGYSGAFCRLGTQYIYGNCTGVGTQYGAGARCIGGKQIIVGDCIGDYRSQGAYCFSYGAQSVTGNCRGGIAGDGAAYSAQTALQIINGNCYGGAADAGHDAGHGAASYGDDAQFVIGNCYGGNSAFSDRRAGCGAFVTGGNQTIVGACFGGSSTAARKGGCGAWNTTGSCQFVTGDCIGGSGVTGSLSYAVKNDGICQFIAGNCKSQNGDPTIYCSAGKTTLLSGVMKSYDTPGASYVIQQESAGVVIVNSGVVLINDHVSGKSIYSSTAQNVVLSGQVVANRVKDDNVTVLVGNLLVSNDLPTDTYIWQTYHYI